MHIIKQTNQLFETRNKTILKVTSYCTVDRFSLQRARQVPYRYSTFASVPPEEKYENCGAINRWWCTVGDWVCVTGRYIYWFYIGIALQKIQATFDQGKMNRFAAHFLGVRKYQTCVRALPSQANHIHCNFKQNIRHR